MTRQYFKKYSGSLAREMEMLVFGDSGVRAIAFPTLMGRFFDWEDRGLVSALSEHLNRGWIQLYCVDSVDAESWYNEAIPPHDRAVRQTEYDTYLLNEVVPFTLQRNKNPFLTVAGPSFGAYQAANFAFRHPDKVGRLIGMTGYYDIKRFTEGYSDDDVYYNNPCEFLPNENDPQRLEAMRKVDIILATGKADSGCANNTYFSGVLWSKNIWHALRLWDGFAHDWSHWQEMLKTYIGGHD